jgi:hypothetical protein
MIAAIYACKSTEQDVSDDAIARPEPRPVAPLGASEIFYFGRMMHSARSRSCRAISIGSPVSTSFAASRSTSCCADRISASTISIASCRELGSSKKLTGRADLCALKFPRDETTDVKKVAVEAWV